MTKKQWGTSLSVEMKPLNEAHVKKSNITRTKLHKLAARRVDISICYFTLEIRIDGISGETMSTV